MLRMKVERILLALAGALFVSGGLLLTAGVAAAQTVSAGSETVNVGETVEVPIVYDLAPQGLAGYKMTISLSNGAVADIEAVDFVAFAGATKVEISPDKDRVTFQAADFGQAVEPGAANVTLAKVVFRGVAPGSSAIQVQLHRFDADGGADLLPTTATRAGSLTVEGPPAEDLSPPRFSNERPPDGSMIGNDQPLISVEITDDRSGVDPDTIRLTITDSVGSHTFDRGSPGASWDGAVFSVDLAAAGVALAEGPVTVTVTAADRAGNFGEALWHLFISAVTGAFFEVLELSISPTSVDVGEEVTITATIKNTGTERGTRQVKLTITDAVGNVIAEDAKTATVNKDATTEIVFKYRPTEAGTYRAEVAADTSKSGSFTVVGLPPPALTIEQAVAQHTGDPALIEDADILWAVELWIMGEPVPGTGGQVIDDAMILKLVELWIMGEPVP